MCGALYLGNYPQISDRRVVPFIETYLTIDGELRPIACNIPCRILLLMKFFTATLVTLRFSGRLFIMDVCYLEVWNGDL